MVLVSETSLHLTVPIRVLDVLRTVCRYLVFRGKPAGRLASFCYLQSWSVEDLWPILARQTKASGSSGGSASCIFLYMLEGRFMSLPRIAIRETEIEVHELPHGLCSVAWRSIRNPCPLYASALTLTFEDSLGLVFVMSRAFIYYCPGTWRVGFPGENSSSWLATTTRTYLGHLGPERLCTPIKS